MMMGGEDSKLERVSVGRWDEGVTKAKNTGVVGTW